MDTIQLGDVSVTRIMEYYGPDTLTPETFFPSAPSSFWPQNEQWLRPDFWDPETNIVQVATQSWLLMSNGKNILVDAGAGNHKERPYVPGWAHMNTNFIANLQAAGLQPSDINIVINTHLHIDHVGWNTYLDGRRWVPTFPNARYLMTSRDFEFWNPTGPHTPNLGRGNQNVFEDSVLPVWEAGLVDLWDEEHIIDNNLRLELAPGHTPGSSVLALNSQGVSALFVGDMVHTPMQILHPENNSCFCEDPDQARETRLRFLARAATDDSLVFPAHFGGHGAARVSADGDGFKLSEWAAFSVPTPS